MEFVVFWLVFATAAAVVGKLGGRPLLGFVLGFLFGLFGLCAITLIVVFSPKKDEPRRRRRRREEEEWRRNNRKIFE